MSSLKTYDETGRLQISSDLMQYYLRAKGSVVLNNQELFGNAIGSDSGGGTPSGRGLYTYDITSPSGPDVRANEIVAFNCSEPIVYTSYPDGNQYGIYPATRSANSPTLSWFTFAPFSGYPDPGYGLRLYDAAGACTWDATAKSCIAAGTYPVSAGNTITLTAGRTYAAFYSQAYVTVNTGYQVSGIYNSSMANFAINTNTITCGLTVRTAFASASQSTGVLTVLDVTGY